LAKAKEAPGNPAGAGQLAEAKLRFWPWLSYCLESESEKEEM
jgi:hypothetical protein